MFPLFKTQWRENLPTLRRLPSGYIWECTLSLPPCLAYEHLRDLWNYNEVKDCWSITLHCGHYADHQSHILGINLFDCLYHLLRLGDLLSCEQSNPMFWVASIFSNVSLRISCTTCPSVIFKKQKNACLFHSKIYPLWVSHY